MKDLHHIIIFIIKILILNIQTYKYLNICINLINFIINIESKKIMETETLTTLKIPNDTLIQIKGLALEKRTTQTDIILQFINK